jgi:hypothetical protein
MLVAEFISIYMILCCFLKKELSKLSSGLKDKVVGDLRYPLIILPTLSLAETPTTAIIVLK